jgi:hypothetical protein
VRLRAVWAEFSGKKARKFGLSCTFLLPAGGQLRGQVQIVVNQYIRADTCRASVLQENH